MPQLSRMTYLRYSKKENVSQFLESRKTDFRRAHSNRKKSHKIYMKTQKNPNSLINFENKQSWRLYTS